MSRRCRGLQATLAEGGLSALRSDEADLKHLEDCSPCFETMEALLSLDRVLRELPLVDAPEGAVAGLEGRLSQQRITAKRPKAGRRWLPPYGGAVAASLLLVMAGGLYLRGDLHELLRHPAAPAADDGPSTEGPPLQPSDRPPIAATPGTGPPVERPGPQARPDPEDPWLAPPSASWTEEEGFTPQPGPVAPTPPPVAEAGERDRLDRGSSTEPPAEDPVPQPSLERAAPAPIPPEPATLPPRVVPPPTNRPGGSTGRGAGIGGLEVSVVDTQGDPLPGATVTISHETGNVKKYSVLSDKDGRAVFPVLRPGGGYVVETSMATFGDRRETGIRVPVGELASAVIQLAEEVTERVRVVATSDVVDLQKTTGDNRFADEFVQDLPVPGRFYQNVLTLAPGIQDRDGGGTSSVHGSRSRDFKAVVGGVTDVDPLTGQFMSLVGSDTIEEIEVITGGAGVEFGRAQGGFAPIVEKVGVSSNRAPEISTRFRSAAAAFFAERERLDNVATRPAVGLWQNRYVPGDPSMRLLRARLLGPARSLLGNVGGEALFAASRRPEQPFDPPGDGALSVSLLCDRRGAEGRRRALVQVGLQAATNRGTRPALDLAIVLDAGGELPLDASADLRALMTAFNEAREVGDRFSLTVAGLSEDVTIEPERFRHGVLSVGLDDWLGQKTADDREGKGKVDDDKSLTQALRRALRRVGRAGDPARPIGSGAVVVVTTRTWTDALDELARLARHGAAAGIPVSVIGVGSGVELAPLETLALAGHGNVGRVTVPADASAAVAREVTAVSRAVARAVRLNIRLAPGVELVDVLGSRPLNGREAAATRRSEREIDRRLADNLGIDRDRSADGDGIQIFIPTFYSGDSHVILLDVIVPGPGPVAEVEARFKDLVHARNGIGRDSLTLPGTEAPRGPLEGSVVKNLLALHLSQQLDDAGRSLRDGKPGDARSRLRQARNLLREAIRSIPGLAGDPEIAIDLALLDGYINAMAGAGRFPAPVRGALADSLRYAAMLKVQPRDVF